MYLSDTWGQRGVRESQGPGKRVGVNFIDVDVARTFLTGFRVINLQLGDKILNSNPIRPTRRRQRTLLKVCLCIPVCRDDRH